MPSYDHECYECQYVWEDTYSMKQDPPTICPKCGGKARRIITTVPACKVILSGPELRAHIKDEQKKIRQQLKTDEKLKANLSGEDNYHNTQINSRKIGEEINQI